MTAKTLRVWPGIVAAVLLVLVRFVHPYLVPWMFADGLLRGLVCVAVIVIWWLFLSRAPWSERLGALLAIAVAMVVIRLMTHESIQNGFMELMFWIYAAPLAALGLVAGAVASRWFTPGRRLAVIAAAIVLSIGSLTLVRTDGIMGEAGSQITWRWTPTAEEQLLARAADEPMAPVPAPKSEPSAAAVSSAPAPTTAMPTEPPAVPLESPAASETPAAPTTGALDPPVANPPDVNARAEWPGFRGPERNSIIRGVRIETDWSASPPVELWRRPIGPGWSSFAVHGDLLYTQEQRGDHEIVACYQVSTGQPIWMHRDATRFWESNGGAGPRGTPTLNNGRVYAFGATGILNALDAGTGKVVWSRNVGIDTGVEVPGWGFASSPLVIADLVVVAAAGRLAAYGITTGQPRWFGPEGGAGYSSPHLLTIDGVDQIMLLRGSRTISVAPADGALLWEHIWQPSADIVQPAVITNGDMLITTADAMGGQGMRRLAVARENSRWIVKERWTSRNLKPYFNDYVVHNGYAYGFDGSILAAINLEDGARAWKGGRYGFGQLLLLPDQDLLLVLSEEGELALVRATPDQFTEVARFRAIEGKTWNHPVLAGDVLLVRNGEEMAAFRLSLTSR